MRLERRLKAPEWRGRRRPPQNKPDPPILNLTHDPTDKQFLAVLCPSCHSKNDTPQRVAMTRCTRAQRGGQFWLSEEIRLAPFPIRTWRCS